MNELNLTLFLGLLAALLAVATLLLVAMSRNMEIGDRYRQFLANKLRKLRLGRMLSALGLNEQRYLHDEPVREIEDQMQRCASCRNTAECDEKMRQGEIASDDLGYCENETVLKSMVEKSPHLASSSD